MYVPDAPTSKTDVWDVILDAVTGLKCRLDNILCFNNYRHDKEFSENEHPRDEDGKFTSGSGSSSGSKNLQTTVTKNGMRFTSEGKSLPEHITSLKIPPAWTDVKYNDDANAALLATGKDSKGRPQAIYSKAFTDNQAALKFARIESLRKEYPAIENENMLGTLSSNPKTKDAAECLQLIMKMGVRPGSETETGAKVKAYGATTLEGKHVVQRDDGLHLVFTGKKGVNLDLRVEDKSLANMLKKRADQAGSDGKLFPNVSDKSLLDYTHTLGSGSFKTKDFRTRLGTQSAYDLVSNMPTPKTQKEYEKQVREIGKKVSEKLGNTPIIALQSYINPVVFSQWREALQ